MPRVFERGFDNAMQFPKGNWKRLKDIVDPPPEYPFDFLKGYTPVHDSHDWRTFDYTFAFEADFTTCRAAVEEELLSKGFKITDDNPRGFGRKWKSVQYERGFDFVVLFQQMRYVKLESKGGPYRIVGKDVEGWVSFQVNLRRTIGAGPPGARTEKDASEVCEPHHKTTVVGRPLWGAIARAGTAGPNPVVVETVFGAQKPQRMQHPRLPILVGVLAGMVGWFVVLALFETSLSLLFFGQPPGKQVWATPGYYCIHRTLLLLTCSLGGAVGVCFSSMRKRNALLFLCAMLGVIAVVAAMFPR